MDWLPFSPILRPLPDFSYFSPSAASTMLRASLVYCWSYGNTLSISVLLDSGFRNKVYIFYHIKKSLINFTVWRVLIRSFFSIYGNNHMIIFLNLLIWCNILMVSLILPVHGIWWRDVGLFPNIFECNISIFQARILEWFAISSSRGSSQPRNWTLVSCVSWVGRQILYHWATWETHFIQIVCFNIHK